MKERVIALGFFDGVHLGHGALLRRAAEEAALRGCTPAVFTFDRPPKEVVTGVPCPLINSPEDRRDLVRRLYRIQDVLMVPFDREMMTTPWDDFIVRILVGRYHAVHLVAGHDHHFGHRNQGTPELLAQKCAQLGLGCDIIPKVEVAGITVSSTYIRRLVELGQIDRANRFLGHPHTLTGVVRHGRGLGSSRLFPTANITIPPHVLVPSHWGLCDPGHPGRRQHLSRRHQCGYPAHREQRLRRDRGGVPAGLCRRPLWPDHASGVFPAPARRDAL